MEHISKQNFKLIHLSNDSENLNKQTKPKTFENQIIALTALQLADSFTKKTTWYYLKLNGWIDYADWNNQNAFWKIRKLIALMKALPKTSVTLKL